MHQQTVSASATECSTIDEFCVRNRLSRSMYYKLKRDGKAPREMNIGSRKAISPESENDWRRSMEAA
jgi:hypothetical protein